MLNLIKPSKPSAPAALPGAKAAAPRRAFVDITNVGAGATGEDASKATKPIARKPSVGGAPAAEGAKARPLTSRPAEEKPAVNSRLPNTARDASVGIAPLTGSAASAAATMPAPAPMSRDADDIDKRDASNALAVTEYADDMYTHFREHESKYRINATYMTRQPHINAKMRATLIDWLVEVHLKFRLVPETLYLCVNYIDRYLALETVERSRLQLVGVTALLLAAKYEEIYPPELRDLVHITDKAYNQQEILECEERMVKALDYKMTQSTAHCFLVRYLKAAHADRRMVWLASYVAERALQEYTLLHHPPSLLAAAAVWLARRTLGYHAWSPTLLKYAGYTEAALAPCLRDLSVAFAEETAGANKLRAAKTKYSSSKFGKVAELPLRLPEGFVTPATSA